MLLFASMLIAATFFYRVVMRYYARLMSGVRLNSNPLKRKARLLGRALPPSITVNLRRRSGG
jgi:hypothetical protein